MLRLNFLEPCTRPIDSLRYCQHLVEKVWLLE